jgi:hypothetical protein
VGHLVLLKNFCSRWRSSGARLRPRIVAALLHARTSLPLLQCRLEFSPTDMNQIRDTDTSRGKENSLILPFFSSFFFSYSLFFFFFLFFLFLGGSGDSGANRIRIRVYNTVFEKMERVCIDRR